MKFGPVPVDEAEGAVLGHSVKLVRRLPKGLVLGPEEIAELRAAGHDTVVVARPGPDDVLEDEAARRIAEALAGDTLRFDRPTTGRCNLFARGAGLFTANRDVIDAVNAMDPGITVATLPDASVVEAGRMVATVKIVPFTVAAANVERASRSGAGAVALRGFRPLRARLISTKLPMLKDSVIAKTEAVTRTRLERLGGELIDHRQVAHDADALKDALRNVADADLLLVFGASAVADEDDVVPDAIRAAGGSVDTFGMPVDPGNLLCCGTLGNAVVIGAPGCARSPAENGFDWALHRVAAGLPLTGEWVRSLGVGGLLMEIHSRPSPREAANDLAVIVLAAGRSTRMGEENKLTRTLEGKPLVAHAVDVALEADIGSVHVVTGHEADAVADVLKARDVIFVANPEFAAGMSTSLKAGLAAVGGARGALVMLGDMPDVSAASLRELVAAFREHDGHRIVAARDARTGRRGNPVIWPARFHEELMKLTGDRGARDILKDNSAGVVTVEIEGAALDLDTPEAFAAREND